ncbi:aldolase/citrate lyase family protein [Streptomyces sp. CLV115]|uniref:DUF6986 family protein n=1 Tax=Streptomyces sp. CLV115 TaxID=3138502 RepID=UPI00313E67B2
MTGLDESLVDDLVPRVRRKLAQQPIEDLRVDFEDGSGVRLDAEEDRAVADVVFALEQVTASGSERPVSFGVRFKSLEPSTRRRGVRSLVAYLTGAAERGLLSAGSVLTLPKVTTVDQVQALSEILRVLETDLGVAAGKLTVEIQVETPQAVLGVDGTALVAKMIQASAGRCSALDYGTYDYSAALGIAAEYQSMEHPAADFAKAVMQVVAAGFGVRLSDGSTNIIPEGDTSAVHRAWELHARLVNRSLRRGYYQGWDLHPAQLPTRYLATYAFYRGGFAASAARLRAYEESVSESGILVEPATVRALADFLIRGLECGAVDESELHSAAGVDRLRLAGLAGGRTGGDLTLAGPR